VAIDNHDVNVAHGTGTVTFTFSEAPTDFSLGHVTPTGGTLSNLTGSGTTYTATFTGAANTDISNASVVVDNTWHEGNGNAGTGGSTGNFVVDTVTPFLVMPSMALAFSSAVATYHQAYGNLDPSEMIDGDFSTHENAWGIWRGDGSDNATHSE